MAFFSVKTLTGSGFIILNVIRAMNITALLAIVAASVVMLVKTFIVSKFFFFDATSHVITAIVSMFLIVSECSMFRGYFARNWPLLSPSHGFVSLGLSMIILGLNMLGNMNKEATSQESLGLPFWRLLLASGILGIIVGSFNVIASYIFRDTSRQITARRVRSHGAISLSTTPDPDLEATPKALSINTHHTGSSSSQTHIPSPDSIFASPKFSPAKRESRFSLLSPARTFRAARQSILPSYHSRSQSRASTSSSYSRFTSGEPKANKEMRDKRRSSVPSMPRLPLQISAPLNGNPQFAQLMRPDLAHHPSLRRGEGVDMI
ncbi:hypothetical protein GQ43DRAFT_121950 [Delitschia confertaspora ATCC 74209]|uniref:DUF7598 domain-containing protein n=1 Tax=Delitschia confertaspora ATCC 74209 TaxID=1513339 RepID=A0A9P4JTC6_9PLEO|nr:hypothetical protein GQ43DRAFT_121950 [Delitschia confertaspora ATCC 74209]